MIRPVVQIVRFYVINQCIGSRSIENLMDCPKYSTFLQHCVNTVMRYPDWAIDECWKYRKEIDEKKFKFDSGIWAMDIRDEDIPKGCHPDPLVLKSAFMEIINWINKNREMFTEKLQEEEKRRYEN